jgi:outer membrane protein assembly factor BamB
MKDRELRCWIFGLILPWIFLSNTLLLGQIESQWRGPLRNGYYPDTGLLKKWPPEGPKLLWRFDNLGIGFSSAAVTSTSIYITGMIKDRGYLYALNHRGKLIWKRNYGPEWQQPVPGSRSTPGIYKNHVYLLSGTGVVHCFHAKTGEGIWKRDIVKDFRGVTIKWGYNESFVFYKDQVFCTPGGSKGAIIALDYSTGKTTGVFKSDGYIRSYCSPILIKRGDRNILVTVLSHGLVGLDVDNGKFLWEHRQTNKTGTHCNSPIYHNGYIYSYSWQFGGIKLALSSAGTRIKKIWHNPFIDGESGGALIVDGYIYGCGYESGRNWQCLDWQTGKKMFSSRKIAPGSVIYADGLLYCYSQGGEMALVKPDPEKLNIISKFKVPQRTGYHLAHPVINRGKLYIRADQSLLVYAIK